MINAKRFGSKNFLSKLNNAGVKTALQIFPLLLFV